MAESDYLHIPREKLVDLCSRSLYTIDGLWFSLLEEKYGLDVALDMDLEVWRRFGLIHGRRVLKTFAIKKNSPIQALVSMIQVDPMLFVYKPEIVTLTDSKLVFHCANCPPQKARIRDGRGEFPCKPVGEALFISYAELVSSKVKLTCLTCPPDPHPSQFWCEWQYEI
ncbi:DUF6125 family protein [Chloroflexota bacterium]